MKKNQPIIIYLQIEKKLRREYYYLSSYLNGYGITMVPVKMENLFDFIGSYNQVDIIFFEKSLRDLNFLIKKCRKKLEFLLEHQKINLFHFSSFEKSELKIHYRFKQFYRFLPLPLSVAEIAMYLSLQIEASNQPTDNSWPGKKSSSISFLKAA